MISSTDSKVKTTLYCLTYSTIGKHLLHIFRLSVTLRILNALYIMYSKSILFSIQYLDALFVKDPQAGMDYHELQVLNDLLPCYEFRLVNVV